MAVEHIDLLHAYNIQTIAQTFLDSLCRERAITRWLEQNLCVDSESLWQLGVANFLLRLSIHITSGCVNALDSCFLQGIFQLRWIQFADVTEYHLRRHFCFRCELKEGRRVCDLNY